MQRIYKEDIEREAKKQRHVQTAQFVHESQFQIWDTAKFFFFFFLKYRGVAGSYGGCHRMLTILQRNMLHQHHRWVSPPASLSNSKWVGFVFCVLFWFSVLWFFFGGLLRLKVKGFSFSRFVLCCVRFWFVSFEVWSMDPWAPMWSCWFFLLEFCPIVLVPEICCRPY